MILSLLLPLFIQASAAPLTCSSSLLDTRSQKYADLEPRGPKTDDFVREQNRIHFDEMRKSTNLKPVGEWLKSLYDVEQVKGTSELPSDIQMNHLAAMQPSQPQTAALSGAARLKLIDRGLGKPTELVLDSKGKEKVLFSSFTIKRNSSINFLRFELTPKKDQVLMFFMENGSTDYFWFQVLDLRTGSVRAQRVETRSTTISWFNDNLAFISPQKIYDLRTGETYDSKRYQELISVSGPWALYAAGPEGKERILMKTNGKPIPMTGETGKIIFSDSDQVLFLSDAESGFEQVVRFDLKTQESKVLVPEHNTVISRAQMIGGKLFLWSMMGLDRRVEVFNPDGQLLRTLRIPPEVSLKSIQRRKDHGVFELTFASSIVSSAKYKWTLTEDLPWESIKPKMMSDPLFKAETQIRWAISKDGTRIPYRMVRRTDIPSKAAYMEEYGGFNLAGYFEPTYNHQIKEFIRRGGVYVAPMIRGGNDIGPDWHAQAQGSKNLIKSAEDVVAVADDIARQGIVPPSKIISTGTSNGGRLSALAGLLSPKSFGLVIPINGVHDLLAKEHLDQQFGDGWSYEFGDSRNPMDLQYMLPISTIEMNYPGQGTLFFQVNGRDDSRVHPAHSRKLQANLYDQAGSQAVLMSLKNSGHWMSSISYQNLIGWRNADHDLDKDFRHHGSGSHERADAHAGFVYDKG